MRVADRDLRAAEFLNHAAEHELAQAKALLAQYGDGAKAPPETWNITAPVPGLVLKVNQESETDCSGGNADHGNWRSPRSRNRCRRAQHRML